MRQRPGRTGPCLCVWLQIFKHSEGEFDLLESIRHEEVLRRSHTSLLIHDLYLQILELTKMTEDNEIKQKADTLQVNFLHSHSYLKVYCVTILA